MEFSDRQTFEGRRHLRRHRSIYTRACSHRSPSIRQLVWVAAFLVHNLKRQARKNCNLKLMRYSESTTSSTKNAEHLPAQAVVDVQWFVPFIFLLIQNWRLIRSRRWSYLVHFARHSKYKKCGKTIQWRTGGPEPRNGNSSSNSNSNSGSWNWNSI
jgi:hypothetical protein